MHSINTCEALNMADKNNITEVVNTSLKVSELSITAYNDLELNEDY